MDYLHRLLNADEPWIVYRTLLDLAERDLEDEEVLRIKVAMVSNPQMAELLEEVSNWPGQVLNSHKSSGQLYHKMVFLADVGFDESHPSIAEALRRMREARNEDGLFTLPANISVSYGGTGVPTRGWALCDAPVLLYAVAKMAKNGLQEARQGTEFVTSLSQPFGFPCVVAPEYGKFRGPGRKTDPCPYATLVTLKLMGLYEDLRESPAAHIAGETLLRLWESSRETHPYMFFMGTDFRKLKAPFIWYDILHVADVLSQWTWIRQDPRFLDMMSVLRDKADSQGMYAPESVWKPWSEWEFGNKGEPSLWITFLMERIEARLRGDHLGEKNP